MADSKKTMRSGSERTTARTKRAPLTHLRAALQEVYAALGEDEQGVKKKVAKMAILILTAADGLRLQAQVHFLQVVWPFL